MAARKSGLGRGLDSLFSDSELLNTQTSAGETEEPQVKITEASDYEKIQYIDINDIKPNSDQPRKFFDETALNELADSIREHGVIQPVLLRPAGSSYELVAGERRWRSARIAGLKKIPAIVRTLDEKTNTFYALIENMQREDLNAIEEAEGIKEIIDRYELTQDEAAKLMGKSRPYISNALRVLRLPDEIKELVLSGKLSQGHAKALASLDGDKLRLEAAMKAAEEGWSVRQIEEFSRKNTDKKIPSKKREKSIKDPDLAALEDELSSVLGTRVSIKGGPASGKITVEYFSAEDLERILTALKG